MKHLSAKKVATFFTLLLVSLVFMMLANCAAAGVLPNGELTLVTGTTELDVTNFASDVQTAVYELYGVTSDRLRISKAGTTVVDSKNNFDWKIYDHYYDPTYVDGIQPEDWSVNHSAYQPYFYFMETNPGDQNFYTDVDVEQLPDSYCRYWSQHIYTKGKDLVFLGYGVPAFKDFMVFPDRNEGEKTIEFAIDQSGVSTHTLEGAGFLFNTSIEDNVMNGYLVYYNYFKYKIELYKLTNVDAAAFHQEEDSGIADGISGITLLASKNMQSEATVKNIKVQTTATSLKFYEDGNTIYDTTGPDSQITIEDTGSGGFGPLVGYLSHDCDELSYFTFKDLAMVSVRTVTFMDLLNEQQWTPRSKRMIVNLDDDSVPAFSDSTLLAQIAAQLAANKVHYIGWGHNLEVAEGVYNQDEAEQLISLNNNRGMFINLDNPEYDTYEKSIAAIAQYVAAVLTPEPDVTPPALGQITPADGATVSSLASISIPVSDSEEGISEEQSTLTLIGNSRGPITGTVSFAEGSLVFTPADVLEADEYTVTATVYDFAGNFSQLISHFTIRCCRIYRLPFALHRYRNKTYHTLLHYLPCTRRRLSHP